MPLLRLHRIAKTYDGGLAAIRRLELDVERGEFVSLIGPSGCGKSTALRIIAGLMAPSEGAVGFPEGRPEIGFVFQEPTLMPWRDALSNTALPLALRGVPGTEAQMRAREALRRVGLAGFEHSYPRALSGGMKMRVSIARALASAPRLLLMDEPFAALDELTRQQLNDDLLKLWREDGLTVIFVTHSVFESTYLSQKVVVMTPRPGRIFDEIRLAAPLERDETYRLSAEFSADATKVSRALKLAMQEGSETAHHNHTSAMA
ncbi:MAG: ABC transporter ATP-binding protein [Rhizomicrobium sp.]